MRWTGFLLLFCLMNGNVGAGTTLLDKYQTHLYAGKPYWAENILKRQLELTPDDDQARFALGTVQFVQAVKNLAQSLYRYGLRSSYDATDSFFDLPFFRIPVPVNPKPESLSYEKIRDVLQQFVNDLSKAEGTLALVESADLALPLNIGLVRLDMNADGEITEDETLWRIFQRIAPLRQVTEAESEKFVIDFDGSDVPWLRAYCHLLMGMGEFFLAYDWHVAFEHTFHALFPGSGLPYSVLNSDLLLRYQKYNEAIRAGDLEASNSLYDKEFKDIWDRDLADLIAFVHLNHWPIYEPKRLAHTLTHLEKMVDLSRASWKLILAEEDKDSAEWIPNPYQTGTLPGMTVTQERVDGWLMFLDEFEALLQGRKLLAHWRFTEGINMRRVFLEPTTFDLILWIQGSASVPYLEKGELVTADTWETIFVLFQGDFFSYAIWFN